MKITKLAFVLGLLNLVSIIIIIILAKVETIENPPIALVGQTPTFAPGVTAAPTKDNRCIIVVDGQKYDVTVFRKLHDGGDIFECNTDMSTVFYQQHTAIYLQSMSKYKI